MTVLSLGSLMPCKENFRFLNVILKTTRALLLGFALLSMSSCKWLGEDSYEAKIIEVNSQQENCFADFSALIKDYFSSNASLERIDVFFSCVEKAIDDFMRRTSEANPEKGYNESEIANLLESFLLDSAEGGIYSKRFLLLKRMFVGGDTQHFKRAEWQKIKILWPNIRQSILNTRELTDSYYFYNTEKEYHKVLEKKQDEFAVALSELLNKFAAAGGEMNAEELMFFKDQILSFDSLKRFRPIFDGIFDLYSSFPTSQPKNWTNAFELIEKALRINAYIRRSNLETDIFTPNGTVYYALVVKAILDTVDYAHSLNWYNPIEQSALEGIFAGLYDSKIVFKNVNSKNEFLTAIRQVGKNLFSPQYDDRWTISKEDVVFLKYKFNTWMQTLVDVLESYDNQSMATQYRDLIYPIEYAKDYQQAAHELYNDVATQSHIYNPMLDDVFSFKTHFIAEPEKSFRSSTQAVFNHFYQASLANIVSFFFDTYGRQKGVALEKDKLVTENTVERIYRDIRPITVAEGIINPLSCSSGSRSFLEANLFSYSGNGDDKVNVYEGMQWFASILSAGTTSRDIYRGAIDAGCAIPGSAKFQNFEYVDAKCFKEFFKKDYVKHLYHIPGFISFINNDDFDKFYNQYFSMVRTCKNNDYPFSFDEVQYATALLQYIESLFEVFDKDSHDWYVFERKKNNILEFSELWDAYNQRFKGVVKRLGEAQAGTELSDMVVEHIYRKLITERKMPYTPEGTWDSAMWFLGGRTLSDPHPYNRLDIYMIFDSVLGAISSGGSGKATQDYCQSLKLAWEEYTVNKTFSIKEPVGICPADQQ